MADTGDISASDPPLPEDVSNQKAADMKQEKRHLDLDKSITATKKSLDKHIEENDKILSSIKGSVTTNTTNITSLQASVTKLQGDLSLMQTKYDATQKLLDEASTNMENFAATITKLDTKFVRNEEELLRCQLIIDGVKEGQQGSRRPKSTIINLLKDLQIDFADTDIKSAFRLGPIKENASHPRSIKVLFASNHFKYDIFRNIQNLRGKEQWKAVHISDAVTIEEQEHRRDMRCIYSAGKAKGVDVKLKGSNIIIDGINYSHKDIHSLPKGLSITEVKIVTAKDGVAFQSHHAYLSNMFPCKIVYEGVQYQSSEHLYHVEMAKHHDRLDLVNKLTKAKDGYTCKRIAREITIADDWEETKIKVMRKIINLKFDQNDGLRDKLLATIGHLYEATKGDSFSCGMSLAQAKDISQETITGANHLGKILVEYRNERLGL